MHQQEAPKGAPVMQALCEFSVMRMIPLPLVTLILVGLFTYQKSNSLLSVAITLPIFYVLQGFTLLAVKRVRNRPLSRFLNEVGDNLAWGNETLPSVRGYVHLDNYNQKLRVEIGREGVYVSALLFCKVVLPWQKIRSVKMLEGGKYAVIEMTESPAKKLVLPWSSNFDIPSTVWKL